MINPHRIKYNNIFSNELSIPDLIMCVAMDNDNGETPSFLNRESVSSESHDGRYKRIHRFKYTETFAPKFSFFKRDLGNFEIDEVRAVLKWLTSRDTTGLLEVYYDDSNVVSFASIGGFVDLQTYKIANNRTIAITAIWDSISPFALSDLYTVTKTITDSTDNKITINIDTDDNKPVYPRITIKHQYDGAPHSVINIPADTTLTIYSDMIPNTVYYNGAMWYWKSDLPGKCTGVQSPNYSGWELVNVDHAYGDGDMWEDGKIYYYAQSGTYYWLDPYTFKASTSNPNLATTGVRFTNRHTDFLFHTQTFPQTVIKNNNSSETITFDGANKIISSSSVNRVIDTDFNLNWLPLLDGKNEITVEGNCEVTFEWRSARKIGEY